MQVHRSRRFQKGTGTGFVVRTRPSLGVTLMSMTVPEKCNWSSFDCQSRGLLQVKSVLSLSRSLAQLGLVRPEAGRTVIPQHSRRVYGLARTSWFRALHSDNTVTVLYCVEYCSALHSNRGSVPVLHVALATARQDRGA